MNPPKSTPKKLRVAVLIDAWFPFYGGGQVHVRELTKRMASDCDFTIFHGNDPSLLGRFLWAFRVVPDVLRKHRDKRFELIHAHAYIAGIPAKILSALLNIPAIYTVHGCNTLDLVRMKKSGKKTEAQTPLWKYLLEKALLTGFRYDRQISVSHNFLEYENVNKNISVIPNGVDTELFDRITVKKKKKFTLIFVGRDDPVKGTALLERTMNTVHSTKPEVRLLKVSKGTLKGKALIKAYKSAHLFVLPSLSEGHPLTLLEAWAAKLPVVVTAVGDNARMVKDGVNGYLVPPADEQALTNAIHMAFGNPTLEALGKSGYNLVKKRFTWKKAAESTLTVYKEILNGAR